MATIVGVRFQMPGKTYYFDPGDLVIKDRDHVIVETVRGIEYGTAVFGLRNVDDSKIKQPLKEVMRLATEEDDKKNEENKKQEEEAYKICKEKIREHGLEMKLVASEYTFDRGKLLFYFTADGRVDFRELVKDLAAVFKTRIELRQVGVRDETKLIGGIGICGRPLCCHSYLNDFAPVSIKMAKEQNLSLNQTKISGTCGRLMCCLKNEQDTYEYLNKSLPKKGVDVVTPEGLEGTVQSVNILRQTVNVVVDLENDEKDLRTYHISELDIGPGRGGKRPDGDRNAFEESTQENVESKKSRRKRGKKRNDENHPEAMDHRSEDAKDDVIEVDEDDNVEVAEILESEFIEEKPKKHKRRRRRSRKKKTGEGENTNSAGDAGMDNAGARGQDGPDNA